MVKRNPLWIRIIAGAAFVYAWVLIVYTPPKHRHHSISLKESDSESQQITKEVDDDIDTNNEAIALDTGVSITAASNSPEMTNSKSLATKNTSFLGGTILLVGNEENEQEKPSTKRPEIIRTDKNVPIKQFENFRSDNKHEIPLDKDHVPGQSQLSNFFSHNKDTSRTNKNEQQSKIKSTDQQVAMVPQVKETKKISQNITSDRQDVPQIIKNSLSNMRSSSESATVLDAKGQSDADADSYPKPQDVTILPAGVCPRSYVVTIVGGGRLANCIWEYVTVWSLARFLPGNRVPFAQKLIVDTLSKVFDGVNLPTVEELPRDCEYCKNTNWTATNVHVFDFIPLKNVKTRFADFKGHIVLPKYSLLLESVLATIEHLKKDFRYKEELVVSAQNIIRNKTTLYMESTKTIDNTRIVYVGIHVRRTDYIPYLSKTHNMTATGPEYFVAAMNYFRKREDLGKPIFLVVSDDIVWVENNLKGNDVFVVSRGGIDNPGYDIALLSHCNHSIIDYGTYGLWAAVYAGGETITMKTTTQIYRILSVKPNWHFVKTSPTGEIVIP